MTIKERLTAALGRIKSSYNRNIHPRFQKAYQSILPIFTAIFAWLYNWILSPIYRWFLSPIKTAITTILKFLRNYIAMPILKGIAYLYALFRDKIAKPVFNILSKLASNIYNSIINSTPFNRTYELLQLKYIWPTGDDFDYKKRKPKEEIAQESTVVAFSMAWKIFFPFSLMTIMMSLGSPASGCFFALACLALFSFALGVSFTATVLHNLHKNPDRAITAIIFASLIALALIYINLTLGGLIFKVASAIIGFGAVCFALAHQPSIQSYDCSTSKAMGSDFVFFIQWFNTRRPLMAPLMPETFKAFGITKKSSSKKPLSESTSLKSSEITTEEDAADYAGEEKVDDNTDLDNDEDDAHNVRVNL